MSRVASRASEACLAKLCDTKADGENTQNLVEVLGEETSVSVPIEIKKHPISGAISIGAVLR